MKKLNPAVKLPKYVVFSSMLGSNKGRTDRTYLRMMASAIHSFEKRKNDSMKKVYKDTSDVEN